MSQRSEELLLLLVLLDLKVVEMLACVGNDAL